jgi:hypothetical protein
VKVFLRLGRAGFYYAGPAHWVRDRQHALDLKTIDHATALGRDVDLEALEIVVSAGHASSDWFLPLHRRQAGHSPTRPACVQSSFPRAAWS